MQDAKLRMTAAKPTGNEPLLSESETIEALGLADRRNPVASLRWLCRTRKLAYVDLARGIRRYRPADVHAYIERQRVAAMKE